MQIKEVIVVEGKSDTNKIKQALCAHTIETNGSAINQETLKMIRHAQQKRGVIVFTDPDYAGSRIRSIIDEHIPGCKHAFLPKKAALSKRANESVGIEHATVEAIRVALKNVYERKPVEKTDITQSDLLRWGLIGSAQASARRERLGEYLHIGYTNGKQLLNRLRMFQINQNELNEAMKHILKENNK